MESYRSQPHDSDFLFAHAEALIKARDAAGAKMEQAALSSAERFNSTHKIANFHVGDIVWLENMKRVHKFSTRWLGPYRIYDAIRYGTFRIHDAHGIVHAAPVNVSHLKRVIYDTGTDLAEQFLGVDKFVVAPEADKEAVGKDEPLILQSHTIPDYQLRHDAFPHPERIAVDNPSAKQMLKVNPRPFKFQDERYANLADEPFDSDAEFEVDRIIGKKSKRGKVYYQVLWKDWSGVSTWEPASLLRNCQQAVQDYEQANAPMSA